MARGTQLITLVDKLRSEIRNASQVSAGVDKIPTLKQTLRRVQHQLYNDFDWPFLRVIATKALAAGQRYYDFPTGATAIDLERIEDVVCWYSGQPHPMQRGIDWEEYAQYNSDSDDRSDPALRWDMRWTGSSTQMEVWPIPSSNDMSLRIKGLRPLRALTSDTDVADLDDELIVLFSAYELLGGAGAKDAQAKLAAGNQLLARMRARMKGGSSDVVMGGGDPYRTDKDRGVIIRVR